jgi:hypothetical protein
MSSPRLLIVSVVALMAGGCGVGGRVAAISETTTTPTTAPTTSTAAIPEQDHAGLAEVFTGLVGALSTGAADLGSDDRRAVIVRALLDSGIEVGGPLTPADANCLADVIIPEIDAGLDPEWRSLPDDRLRHLFTGVLSCFPPERLVLLLAQSIAASTGMRPELAHCSAQALFDAMGGVPGLAAAAVATRNGQPPVSPEVAQAAVAGAAACIGAG